MALSNKGQNRNIYFGQRLKELRESFNLTQAELAVSIGIDAENGSQTVSNWETSRREPSFNTLCTIADFFGVTTDHLLGRSSKSQNENKDKEFLILQTDKLDAKQKATLFDIIELISK